MMKMVNEAVGEFRQNPFSTAACESSLLQRAVLLLLSRHRLQRTGSEGGDDDAARSEQRHAALTADELFDRLADVSASSWPPIHDDDDDDDDDDDASEQQDDDDDDDDWGGQETSTRRQRGSKRKRADAGDAATVDVVDAVKGPCPADDSLLVPSFYLFERALDGLLTRSMLLFSASKTCSNLRSGKFHLHPLLTHADILSAVKGTCLEKFCRSERA